MKNDVINLNAHLEERTSKEGTKYEMLILKLTDDYEKEVYLSRAERQLLKLDNKKSTQDLPFL